MNFLRLWYRRRKKNNGEEICICFDDIRAHFERFINNAQSFMRTKMRSPQTQFRNIQLNVGIRLITSLESNRILCGKRYTCVNKRINTIRYSRNNIPWMMRVAHLLHNIHFFNSFISVTFSSRKLTQFISSNWWFCLHLGVIWKANRKVTIRHRYPMHGLSQKPEIWKKKKKNEPQNFIFTQTYSLRMQLCKSKVVRRLVPLLLKQSTGELSMYEWFLSISQLPTFEVLSDRPLGWALSLFAFV